MIAYECVGGAGDGRFVRLRKGTVVAHIDGVTYIALTAKIAGKEQHLLIPADSTPAEAIRRWKARQST